MRFLLDHDVPSEIGRVLKQAGHDAIVLQNIMDPATDDPEVFDCAVREERILVTCNRDDFLRLAAERAHFGLIVLIRRRSRIQECGALIRLLQRAGEPGISGNINFA